MPCSPPGNCKDTSGSRRERVAGSRFQVKVPGCCNLKLGTLSPVSNNLPLITPPRLIWCRSHAFSYCPIFDSLTQSSDSRDHFSNSKGSDDHYRELPDKFNGTLTGGIDHPLGRFDGVAACKRPSRCAHTPQSLSEGQQRWPPDA